MCHHLIRIPNPKRSFVKGLDKPFIYVPCGHCSECRSKQQRSWNVRITSEFAKFKANGSVWFPTLTYNNENIPHFKDVSHGVSFPCFSPSHIQFFIKKLRYQFTKLGHDCRGMKFIVCSEFGSLRGRPHYHALIFLPFVVAESVFRAVVKRSWTNSESEPLGFIGASKKGIRINSVDACSYVSKYICKDMVFMTKYNISEYLNSLCNELQKLYYLRSGELSPFSDTELEIQIESKKEQIRRVRYVLPRHFQSIGFGLPILEQFTNNDGTFDLDKFMAGKCRVLGSEYLFNIPDYITRKVYYDLFTTDNKVYKYDEETGEVFNVIELEKKPMFVLNDKGFKKYLFGFDEIVKSYYLDILPFFDRQYLNKASPYIARDSCEPVEYLERLLAGRSLYDVVIYSLCYRDVHCSCPFVSLDCLRKQAPFIYVKRKLLNRDPDYNSSYKHDPSILNDGSTFNNLSCFADFDELLDFISDLNTLISDHKSLAEFKKNIDISYVSQFKNYLTL